MKGFHKPEGGFPLEPEELEGESELMSDLSEELAEASSFLGNPDDGITQTNLRQVAQELIKLGYQKYPLLMMLSRFKQKMIFLIYGAILIGLGGFLIGWAMAGF